MSRQLVAPNQFLKRIVAEVATRHHADLLMRTRALYGDNLSGFHVGALGIFGELMGGVSKPGVSYWISRGGVPRKREKQLRLVLRQVGLRLPKEKFEALLLPEKARGNPALRQALDAVRHRKKVSLCAFAAHMGMSYWQLHRCEEAGGLPADKLPAFAAALAHYNVPVPPDGLAACVCEERWGQQAEAETTRRAA